MKEALPYLLVAGIASGCDRIEEVECSDVDEAFYAAQVEDLNAEDFQSILRDRFAAAGLDGLLSPEDLAAEGDILDLRCATSIQSATHKGEAIMATDVAKNIIWVDVDSPAYLPHQETFALSMGAHDVLAYTNRYNSINAVIHMTGHEFAHDVLPDSDHSDETRAFIEAIPPDNGMGQCEGWTFVSQETDDLVFDVMAEVACAYDSYVPGY